jgi:hypothetical protein
MADIQAGTTYADGAQVTAVNLNAHVNNATLVPGAISDKTAVATVTGADSILILQSATLKKATITQLQASITPDLTPYVNKNGSVAMTGELTLSSSTPAAALSAASRGYVDTGLATKQGTIGYTPANKAGDTFTGAVILNANPSVALGAATKQYVDAAVSGGELGFTPVNKAGDTNVGPIALSVDPVSALQVTTKQYVDTGLATKQASLGFTPVNKAGDTGVGSLTIGAGNTLTLAADPALPLQASTKAYVDAQVTAAQPSLVPAGAVMAFYRSTPPTGWLECNGQSAAAYPSLVALGITNIPDLRGEFVRGWDNGKGTDPGRALASSQLDAFQGHFHQFYSDNEQTSGGGGGRNVRNKDFLQSNGTVAAATTDNTNGTPRTASETRPRNIALMYCIKT